MTLSTMLATMGEGMLRTCAIFFLTILFSMPLGMVVMFLRRSRFKVVQWITKLYIAVMRGTPLMLQLMAIYYIPYYVFGIKLNLLNIGPMDIAGLHVEIGWVMTACCIGFILNYAAYFAEIYRGGIQSIARGQYEAAEVLGYSSAQTFMKIVLPQVIKRILPAMGNEVITLVKDTSLAFVLALAEMFTVVKQIVASEVTMIPFILAALFYWLFTILAEFVLGRIEKRLSYYHD
jgi:polar amino acid transport system permease protein